MYSNGNSIPIDDDGTVPPKAVVLHIRGAIEMSALGNKQVEYIEEFVGTAADREKYVRDR